MRNTIISKKDSLAAHQKAEEFALTCELEELEVELTQVDYDSPTRFEIITRISEIESKLKPNKIRGIKEKIS
jgi:hypothetical protein